MLDSKSREISFILYLSSSLYPEISIDFPMSQAILIYTVLSRSLNMLRMLLLNEDNINKCKILLSTIFCPFTSFFNFFCLYLLISFVSLRKSFFVIICVICIWFSTFLADFMRFFLEKHFIICSSSSVIRLFIIIWPEINKTFIGPVVKPHLDYADVIYDRAFNESFHQRLESIQYNAAITITGTIRGTSSEKLFQELGLETLKPRRWFIILVF